MSDTKSNRNARTPTTPPSPQAAPKTPQTPKSGQTPKTPSTPTTPKTSNTAVSTAKSNSNLEKQPESGTGVKDAVDRVWMGLISIIMMIVRFLHSAFEVVADAIVKLYRICLFCYRKPQHAKELFLTTIHLIRVSYDAEIWSWTDMWEVLKSHLITPMTKSVPISHPRRKRK